MARRKETSRIEPAHSLMYEPGSLPLVANPPEAEALLQRITPVLKNPFNIRQEEAFKRSFEDRLLLVWGPPGTGKTTVLAGIILGWLEHAATTGISVRIGIGASNYNALDNVLSEAVEIYERHVKQSGGNKTVRFIRVRSDHQTGPQDTRLEDIARSSEDGQKLAQALDSSDSSLVVGSTWMQLGKLSQYSGESRRAASRWFDLLIIDEASQMDVSSAGAYFLLLTEQANVVMAGDHRQLGPIYGFNLSEHKAGLLDCIFSYMQLTHEQLPIALNENYRNNDEIAAWPRVRFYEQDFRANFPTRRLNITLPDYNEVSPPDWTEQLPWTKNYLQILDPNLPVVVITYGAGSYTLSNSFEAQTVAALTYLYRSIIMGKNKLLDEKEFWEEKLGIVTPHRAQIAAIRNRLIASAGFSRQPSPIVDTVDRFQGLERDLIISSYTVADPDFVGSEEEFILSPRRFNVTLTRARSKFIMLVSDAIIHYLPSDMEVATDAAHIQLFVEKYCPIVKNIELPFLEDDGSLTLVPCRLRVPA